MVLSGSTGVYLGLLGLLGLERLFELSLSRRNARRALEQGGREVGHAHYRVMAGLHTLFLLSCALEVVLLGRPFLPALFAVALLGALLAQLLRYWAIRTLGERWNVRILFVPGLPPVTAGPYRFIRHPNYLAVGMEMLCVPLIHGAWLTAALFSIANAALLTVRIRAEEAALGGAYQAAFASVRRFLPRRELRAPRERQNGR
jgi:methyltransferase